MKRAPLMRKMSFTSSLDNIAIASDEKEKVHLSCFSREMGSNVDLVQVCQDQGQGKHEVKLEFEIEANQTKSEAETEAKIEAETKAEVEIKAETKAEIQSEVEVKAETKDEVTAKIESSCQEAKEAIEQRLTAEFTVDNETVEKTSKQKEEEEEEEEEEEIREEVVTLHKIRKAPSIDGLFQRQDVQAAFTFTLPFQNEQPTTKLALEIPNLS